MVTLLVTIWLIATVIIVAIASIGQLLYFGFGILTLTIIQILFETQFRINLDFIPNAFNGIMKRLKKRKKRRHYE